MAKDSQQLNVRCLRSLRSVLLYCYRRCGYCHFHYHVSVSGMFLTGIIQHTISIVLPYDISSENKDSYIKGQILDKSDCEDVVFDTFTGWLIYSFVYVFKYLVVCFLSIITGVF